MYLPKYCSFLITDIQIFFWCDFVSVWRISFNNDFTAGVLTLNFQTFFHRECIYVTLIPDGYFLLGTEFCVYNSFLQPFKNVVPITPSLYGYWYETRSQSNCYSFKGNASFFFDHFPFFFIFSFHKFDYDGWISLGVICLKFAHFLQSVGLYLALNLGCFQTLFLQVVFSPAFFSVAFWIFSDMNARYFIVPENSKALFILSSIHIFSVIRLDSVY